MGLTRFAIRQPIIVTLFFLAIAVFGLVAYFTMGENTYPNVQFPFVGITADYPGASPEEMERLVIQPIEDQLQNVRHVDRIIATAQDGSGFVGVRFKLGTNIDSASSDVQQAVNAARATLPNDLDPPLIERFDPSTQPIMQETVTSSSMNPVALSSFIQKTIIPDLQSLPGVGQVQVGGSFTRQITIQPDPGRLLAVNATLGDVVNAVGQGNVSLPGGRLDQPYQEATVGVRADITQAQQIATLPLPVAASASAGTFPAGSVTPGSQLRVGDVATIIDGTADQRVITTINGKPGMVIDVARDSDGDTKNTTAVVRAEFKNLASQYPQLSFSELNADADFMHDAISGVLQNLGEGIILTAIVLLLFLHVWRSALVVMIAIPSSLLATFTVMKILGFTIDLLSLMGLSLIIGILVDDSIVVLENITRHREMGKGPEDAAIVGRTEIGGAAIAITLVDVVVFTPIAFMSGIIGEYMREYGLVIVTATLFSLLVSFTLTPLLAARWAVLRKPRPATGIAKGFVEYFDGLRTSYHDRGLPWALKHPYLVFFGSFGLVLASIVIGVMLVPTEFQPYTEWGGAVVTITYPPGTPIGTTQAGVQRLTGAIEKMQGVQFIQANVGQASNGFADTLDGNVAELDVFLEQSQRHRERDVVRRIDGLGSLVPSARITAAGEQNGGGADITYTLSGEPGRLAPVADKLVAFISKIPGTTDIQSSNSIAGPRLDIEINRPRAALLNVAPQTAAITARAAIGGVIATKIRQPEGLIDAVVQLPPNVRNTVSNDSNVDVRADDGTLVPLMDVADFRWTKEPLIIQREDRQRIVQVTANMIGGAPSGNAIQKIDRALAQPGFLPTGVIVKKEGDTKLLGELVTNIMLALGTSFVLIYMLLVVLYRSYLEPIVIMTSVPVAIVGALGILTIANVMHMIFPNSLFFSGQTLNIFSMLGIVMLMGLVAKNGILLVDYANTLRSRGLSLVESIHESASVRFRPIVMTTAAMVMGMLPLALGFTEGAEFRKSMGTVIIGGLISSLFLTLFLVPVVYVALVGFAERLAKRRQERKFSLVSAEESGAAGSQCRVQPKVVVVRGDEAMMRIAIVAAFCVMAVIAALVALRVTSRADILAPGATAPNIQGQSVYAGKVQPFSLSNQLKKGAVVLYFFPAAFTSG